MSFLKNWSRPSWLAPVNQSGAAPASATQPPAEAPPSISLCGYGQNSCVEKTLASVKDVEPERANLDVVWLHISGSPEAKMVKEIGDTFKLHELALRDVMSQHQRAKVEQYDDCLFIVTRIVTTDGGRPRTEQLSLFLGKGFIITFLNRCIPDAPPDETQSDASPDELVLPVFAKGATRPDALASVRERIRQGRGLIRAQGADYLAYSIIDALTDEYFPVLEALGEKLEQLEDSVLVRTDKQTPAKVHGIKRDLTMVRRAIWPQRDAINVLCRDGNPLITDKTRVYFRDCYDHTVRIMDFVESYKELCSDLMDLYLTAVNNRMNEVMKVLTVVATIFIPPTVITGIYGMNFTHMPELSWPWGYPFALSLMALLTAGTALFLWRKGWFRRSL